MFSNKQTCIGYLAVIYIRHSFFYNYVEMEFFTVLLNSLLSDVFFFWGGGFNIKNIKSEFILVKEVQTHCFLIPTVVVVVVVVVEKTLLR